MKGLKSRDLLTITMKLAPPLELGDTPVGNRRVFTVSSGQFLGDRLRGDVLSEAGSDLLLVRGDGSSQQDVRLSLRTDDGALILMTYRGVRHASPEVSARIARGEPVAEPVGLGKLRDTAQGLSIEGALVLDVPKRVRRMRC